MRRRRIGCGAAVALIAAVAACHRRPAEPARGAAGASSAADPAGSPDAADASSPGAADASSPGAADASSPTAAAPASAGSFAAARAALAAYVASLPRGDEKRAPAYDFPAALLEAIQREAVRLDVSISWSVQYAWLRARGRIATLADRAAVTAALAAPSARFAPASVRQPLYWPVDMIEEVEREAARLHVAPARLVLLAWVLAAPEIAAIAPGADGFE